MSIYFIGFGISLILLFFANLISEKRSVFSVRMLALVPPAIVAGIRDLTIGTDIGNYGEFNFTKACQFNSLIEYIRYIKKANGVEAGYSILNYVVSRFTDSISVFFFILNFLTLFFILLALYQFRDKHFITWGILGYYLIFWGTSLNVMRQSMAAAIVLFAVSILINQEYSWHTICKTMILIILASTVHQTAYLALIIIVIYAILRKQSKYISISWMIIAILLFFVLDPTNGLIVNSMQNLPFLGKYYDIFLKGGMSYVSLGSGMSLKTVLVQSFPLIIICGLIIKFHDFSNESKLILVLSMIAISFEFLNMKSGVIARLGMYFSIIQVVAVPRIATKLKIYNGNWIRNLIFLYMLLECIWVIHSGNGEIYPYKSQILENFFLK